MFSIENQCPERILSAETDKLHTTYYEILSPTLEDTDNQPNILFKSLDQKILCSLFDILFWKDGPRLRDKLSHGVCDPILLSRELTELSMNCALYLVSLNVPPKLNDSKFVWNQNIFNYQTFFHPISSLQRSLKNFDSQYIDFYNDLVVECFKNHRSNNHRILKFIWEKDLLLKIQKYIEYLKGKNTNNLFIPLPFDDSIVKYSERKFIIDERIPNKFSGRIGNCVSADISKIRIIEKIILFCGEFINKARKQLKYVEGQNTEKDENHYSKLMDNMYAFYLIINFNVNIAMYCLESNDLELKLREQSKNVVESMQNSVFTNVWNKLEKLTMELLQMIEDRQNSKEK